MVDGQKSRANVSIAGRGVDILTSQWIYLIWIVVRLLLSCDKIPTTWSETWFLHSKDPFSLNKSCVFESHDKRVLQVLLDKCGSTKNILRSCTTHFDRVEGFQLFFIENLVHVTEVRYIHTCSRKNITIYYVSD